MAYSQLKYKAKLVKKQKIIINLKTPVKMIGIFYYKIEIKSISQLNKRY